MAFDQLNDDLVATLSAEAERLAREANALDEMQAEYKARKESHDAACEQLGRQMLASGMKSFTTSNGINPRARMVQKWFCRLDDGAALSFLRENGYDGIVREQVSSWTAMQSALNELAEHGVAVPDTFKRTEIASVAFYGRRQKGGAE